MAENNIIYFMKYNSQIFRNMQSYIDRVLEKYELSSGTYSYLLNIYFNEGTTQSRVGNEIGHDKAMSARTIKKLIEQGFIYKESDREDSRLHHIFLTEKGKNSAPKVKEEVESLSLLLTEDVDDSEKEILMKNMEKIFLKMMELKE